MSSTTGGGRSRRGARSRRTKDLARVRKVFAAQERELESVWAEMDQGRLRLATRRKELEKKQEQRERERLYGPRGDTERTGGEKEQERGPSYTELSAERERRGNTEESGRQGMVANGMASVRRSGDERGQTEERTRVRLQSLKRKMAPSEAVGDTATARVQETSRQRVETARRNIEAREEAERTRWGVQSAEAMAKAAAAKEEEKAAERRRAVQRRAQARAARAKQGEQRGGMKELSKGQEGDIEAWMEGVSASKREQIQAWAALVDQNPLAQQFHKDQMRLADEPEKDTVMGLGGVGGTRVGGAGPRELQARLRAWMEQASTANGRASMSQDQLDLVRMMATAATDKRQGSGQERGVAMVRDDVGIAVPRSVMDLEAREGQETEVGDGRRGEEEGEGEGEGEEEDGEEEEAEAAEHFVLPKKKRPASLSKHKHSSGSLLHGKQRTSMSLVQVAMPTTPRSGSGGGAGKENGKVAGQQVVVGDADDGAGVMQGHEGADDVQTRKKQGTGEEEEEEEGEEELHVLVPYIQLNTQARLDIVGPLVSAIEYGVARHGSRNLDLFSGSFSVEAKIGVVRALMGGEDHSSSSSSSSSSIGNRSSGTGIGGSGTKLEAMPIDLLCDTLTDLCSTYPGGVLPRRMVQALVLEEADDAAMALDTYLHADALTFYKQVRGLLRRLVRQGTVSLDVICDTVASALVPPTSSESALVTELLSAGGPEERYALFAQWLDDDAVLERWVMEARMVTMCQLAVTEDQGPRVAQALFSICFRHSRERALSGAVAQLTQDIVEENDSNRARLGYRMAGCVFVNDAEVRGWVHGALGSYIGTLWGRKGKWLVTAEDGLKASKQKSNVKQLLAKGVLVLVQALLDARDSMPEMVCALCRTLANVIVVRFGVSSKMVRASLSRLVMSSLVVHVLTEPHKWNLGPPDDLAQERVEAAEHNLTLVAQVLSALGTGNPTDLPAHLRKDKLCKSHLESFVVGNAYRLSEFFRRLASDEMSSTGSSSKFADVVVKEVDVMTRNEALGVVRDILRENEQLLVSGALDSNQVVAAAAGFLRSEVGSVGLRVAAKRAAMRLAGMR